MKRDYSLSKIIYIVIIVVMLLSCAFLINNESVYAANKHKSFEYTHVIMMPESPVFIPIAVKAKYTYIGTYSDSGSKRTFTKHDATASFSSANDKYLIKQLTTSVGTVTFYSPGTTTTCTKSNCSCTFYVGGQLFSVKHKCSYKHCSCTKGGGAYCKGAYTITGGSNPVSRSLKITGLAK